MSTLNSIGKEKREQLRQIALSAKQDPDVWAKDKAMLSVFNEDVTDAESYGRLINKVQQYYPDLFRLLFVNIFMAYSKNLVETIHDFTFQFALLVFTKENIADYAENLVALEEVLREELEKSQEASLRHATLSEWVRSVFPGYCFGATEPIDIETVDPEPEPEPERRKTKRKSDDEQQPAKKVKSEPVRDEPAPATKSRKRVTFAEDKPAKRPAFEFTDMPDLEPISTDSEPPFEIPKNEPKPAKTKKEATTKAKKTTKKATKEATKKETTKADKPKKPKPSKKAKKPVRTLEEVQADDFLQVWDYPLNADKTEPEMGLVNAIHEARTDSKYRIIKASETQDGDRFFGRRLILKTEFYQSSPARIAKSEVQKDGTFGIHECTSATSTTDYRNLRKLNWKGGRRFWNLSKFLADASSGKQRAYLNRETVISKGGYLGVDLVGRQLNKDGRLMIVREIHDSNTSMIVKGGIAMVRDGRIISQVPDVRVLLPDTGSELNEISYEVASKLGLYDRNLVPGPDIRTSTGTYSTYKTQLTLEIDADEVRKFQPKFKNQSFPEFYRALDFVYPREPGNRNSWDVLVGVSGAIDFGLMLEYSK